ncbi:MAG: TRAP transporter large permease subunit [Planctomycetaceae bacterium]|nr:TRAP transporter large permease subunit [Planctomycetaceae bacterium]
MGSRRRQFSYDGSGAVSIDPLFVLAIGIITVIGLILVFRVNAFLALITAAIVVSLFAPGDTANKISRVADAFGAAAGKIAIVIALAAIIGECMMLSGAADRVVQAFLNLLGEKRASWALLSSGYVLAVPVFFDTVFYLLVPLARSLYRKTHKNYLLYILAIAAGGAITHTLVPPTPGPLAMAENLKVDVGIMILVGGMVALPAAVAGLLVARIMDAKLNIPYRENSAAPVPEPESAAPPELPPLWLSILPVVLPVILISGNTALKTLAAGEGASESLVQAAAYSDLFGNSNFALLLSTVVAIYLLWRQRRLPLKEIERMVEQALMSAGVIILITAGGGAFGAMLKEAQVGDRIKALFEQGDGASQMAGMVFLFLGFGIATLLKVAQGSSTVAMITGSGMLYAMLGDDARNVLQFHPVYLATAIGGGSLMGSWMNDSGFWIFAKMGGLTEAEALKSWTIMLLVLGLVSLGMSVLLAMILPMTSVA